MSRSRLLAIAASLTMLVAVLGAAAVVAQDAPEPPTATPNPVPLDTPTGDGTAVRIKTDLGDILIGLFNESAPVASENFQNLVESGFYDGVGFHRVVRDFVVQGGDPEGTGRGGPGYTITDEQVVGEYGRGIVAMARTPAPNSQGSQFFFVLDDAARPALESANTYVIFGRVLEGMDVVDAIAAQGPEADFIEDPVVMREFTIEQVELPPEATPQPASLSEAAAEALAAQMPTEIGGVPLQGTTFTADQILTNPADDSAVLELTSIAQESGAEINTLSIATAGADAPPTFITLLAGSIPGVDAELTRDPMISLILGGLEGSVLSEETIGGRAVTVIRAAQDADATNTIRVVTGGDVVWFIVADDASVEEVIGSLPLDAS